MLSVDTDNGPAQLLSIVWMILVQFFTLPFLLQLLVHALHRLLAVVAQAVLPSHHLKELRGVGLKQVDFRSHGDAKAPVFDCCAAKR